MAACKCPEFVYNKYINKKVWSECGHCSACLENRRQQWKFRFMKEKEVSGLCTHLTLQYDNEHLGNNCLDIRDLQLFNKRLRSMGFIYKFYAIGEYGTKDKRKHFHMALFLHSEHDFQTLKEAVIKQWKNGYIFFTKLTFRRMGYVLHYHVRPKEVDGKKTLATQSKGIGIDWLDNPEMSRFLVNTKTVRVQGSDGEFYTIPRYYRKKLGISLETDNVPKVIQNLCEIKGKSLTDITKDELRSYYAAIKRRELKRIENYNNKSN